MEHLVVWLLDSFQITLDGEPVTAFESDRVRTLLAYLAIEAHRPQRRERLVGLLWPDWPEGSASLSQDYGAFFGDRAGSYLLGALLINTSQTVEMVNRITGFDYTLEDVVRLGRKTWCLRRELSNLFDVRAEHEQMPRLMMPLQEGLTECSTPNMDLMLNEFYQLRGFNEDEVPCRDILEELGLAELTGLPHPTIVLEESTYTAPFRHPISSMNRGMLHFHASIPEPSSLLVRHMEII
jgi:hypothetical protein